MKLAKQTTIYLCLILCSAFITACGGGGSSASPAPSPAPAPAPTPSPTPAPASYSLMAEFLRVDQAGLDPIDVDIFIQENATDVSGDAAEISVSSSRGTVSAVTEISAGHYRARLTPALAAEHEITIEYEDQFFTRTALVIDTVHADWGQPMAVEGLVNTAGYEDGAMITDDGEYLFVQYGPIRFSALIAYNLPRNEGGCEGHRLEFPLGTANRCTHDWFDRTIGPHGAPERPGFFDGRISGDMLLHNAASWGIGDDATINFAPSTTFYGFSRQSDGSYAEPFFLAFDDENDGIINPYGLSVHKNSDGSAYAAFTLNDPSDAASVDLDGNGSMDIESYFDVYVAEINLGEDSVLGSFEYSGTPGTAPVRGSNFDSQKINFGSIGIEGSAGTQGNPQLYKVGQAIASIWTDDEYDDGGDRGDISVYLLDDGEFTNGTWTKVVLPSDINSPEPQTEFQPFFTGEGLYYTRSNESENPSIHYAAYTGQHSAANLADNAFWSARETILATEASLALGSIVAVGEPSIATIDGDEYMFFVYAYNRSFDSEITIPDINMEVGFVKKN